MILHPTQEIVASDTHRFRVVVCGRRWGKSTLDTEEIKGKALVSRERRIKKLNIPEEQKQNILEMHKLDDYQCRVDYFAPTFDDARDIIWMPLKRELRGVTIGKPNDGRLELIVRNLDGGKSLVKLRSWENVENFRGKKSDFVILDEVRKYKSFWMYWMEVIRPTLSDYMGEGLFNTTTNGFDHVYDLFNLEATDKDFKSFHYLSSDNPFLSKDELAKAKSEMTEDRYAQEYEADFRKTEGLVYKEFSREKNVSTETPKNITDTIIGIDFGYTNPAAIIPIRIDGDSHYWIGEEWYKSRCTTEAIAEQAILYKSTKCYPDPAEPDRIAILTKAGLNCREVSKDIVAGVDHIRELFKQNRIHIHPDCKNLIMEIETYRYPDKKPDHPEPEKPISENCHALDALRYALYTNRPELPERPDPVWESRGTYYED